MNKFLTSRFGKQLLMVGFSILVLCFVISLYVLRSVYGAAGNLDTSGTSDLVRWQIVSRVNLVLGIFGYMAVGAGLIILIVSRLRRKRA